MTDKDGNARRQAAFKARKEEQGFKRATVWIREADWQAGYNAGLTGGPLQEPAGIDGLSYASGFVEGKARRQLGTGHVSTAISAGVLSGQMNKEALAELTKKPEPEWRDKHEHNEGVQAMDTSELSSLYDTAKKMNEKCECECVKCVDAKKRKFLPVDGDSHEKHIRGMASDMFDMDENQLIETACNDLRKIIEAHCKVGKCGRPLSKADEQKGQVHEMAWTKTEMEPT